LFVSHTLPKESFPKEMRLRKRREFVAVQTGEGRTKLQARRFLVISRARTSGDSGPGRIGITVSKKVGNAVTRNRIRRWVREFVRRNRSWLPLGRDVVVIAKHDAGALSHQDQVSAELSSVGKRLQRC
jgi:ribonuclease P protein component